MNYQNHAEQDEQELKDRIQYPEPRYGWIQRLVRRWSRWAWAAELRHRDVLFLERQNAANVATLRKLQLGLLEELFREKQGKISRLQQCYTDKKRPVYEDLRKEQPIKDAESLAQSISVLASRADAYRQRTGKQMRISDGTIQGVPGDKPNVEVGDPWRA